MSWLYVTEAGARLSKQGGVFSIWREHEIICEVPSELVEGVVVIDAVQVSSAVVVDCLRRGVPLTWLSTRGEFFGRLESTRDQDVFLQAEQFALREDDAFRLMLARRVVFGKVYNQRTVLRRYNRTAKLAATEGVLREIRAVADHINTADSIEKIMGYEGIIARMYFAELGRMVPTAFGFKGRTRRPPLDRFNAMLSFGYTLLMYDFYTAAVSTGLHPYVGFLHALRNGHPALCSDLMEPWRPAVVDSLCLSLVAHHEIRAEHFDTSDPEGAVYLDRVGRRIFIKAYEKKLQSLNGYFGGEYSWRHTIKMECESLTQALREKDADRLRPMVIR